MVNEIQFKLYADSIFVHLAMTNKMILIVSRRQSNLALSLFFFFFNCLTLLDNPQLFFMLENHAIF